MRRRGSPSIGGVVRAEWWTLREALRVSRRSRWYAAVAARLIVLSLVLPRRMRLARLGFFVLQRVDDLADGDLVPAHGVPPLTEVDAIVTAWNGEPDPGGVLSRGTRDAVEVLRARLLADRGGRGPDAVEAVARLMATMRRDHDRRLSRAVWGGSQIAAQLHSTFEDSLALMIVASGGTRARVTDIPALVDAMCWCSVVRDIEEDLEVGICNIPREVLEEANLRGAFARGDVAGVLAHERVRDWWLDEHRRVATLVPQVRVELRALRSHDRRAALAVGEFVRAVEQWQERTAHGPPVVAP